MPSELFPQCTSPRSCIWLWLRPSNDSNHGLIRRHPMFCLRSPGSTEPRPEPPTECEAGPRAASAARPLALACVRTRACRRTASNQDPAFQTSSAPVSLRDALRPLTTPDEHPNTARASLHFRKRTRCGASVHTTQRPIHAAYRLCLIAIPRRCTPAIHGSAKHGRRSSCRVWQNCVRSSRIRQHMAQSTVM